jgi:hypothetical protein
LRGSIDADEIAVGVTVGERLRREAGATAEVDDAAAAILKVRNFEIFRIRESAKV